MSKKKKSQAKKKIVCQRCHRVGHTRENCYTLICDYCTKTGHEILECRKLQNDKKCIMENARQLCKDDFSKNILYGEYPENQPTTSDGTSSYNDTEISSPLTVGNWRELLLSSEKDIIEITCEELKNRTAKMVVSTNLPISLIKIGKLKDNVTTAREVLILEDAFSSRVKTICIICLCIRVNKETILHPCRVVSDDFYIETDGVLGRDFIIKSQVTFGEYVELAGVQIPFIGNNLVRQILKVDNLIEVSIKESDSETITDSS
ncbi:uncharacterized protein [Bombus fervidus]|uniref:uncharacterized protein n=1 Tax=Bombus fervidus TaxID=203811 RepID=UPI003D18E182